MESKLQQAHSLLLKHRGSLTTSDEDFEQLRVAVKEIPIFCDFFNNCTLPLKAEVR